LAHLASPTRARPQLDFLDGFRGALVLLVVTGHAIGYSGLRGEIAGADPALGQFLVAVELRVPMFFVLSGYVLMIAVARDPELRLRGGMAGHVRRRARRLLLPYFAALALSLGLIATVPLLQIPAGTAWDPRIPVTWESVVTHALLVHNFLPEGFFRINAPLWTMAVEWQLGLLMPLLLVFWRRRSPLVVILLLLLLAGASSATGVMDWSAPILLPLFALGMYAAHVTHRDDVADPVTTAILGRRWLGMTCCTVLIVGAVLVGMLEASMLRGLPTIALRWALAGSAAAIFLALVTHRQSVSAHSPTTALAHDVLAWAPLRHVGLISYSAYLIHSPILAIANLVMIGTGLPTALIVVLQLLVTTPVVFVVGLLFAVCFERPVMSARQRAALDRLLPGRPYRSVDSI
jgi:peptidoglycan/LPS O-acetylase OafA/YrhL